MAGQLERGEEGEVTIPVVNIVMRRRRRRVARTVMVIATSSIAWKVHLYGIKCNGDRGSGTCADNAARMLISTLASKLINRFGGTFALHWAPSLSSS